MILMGLMSGTSADGVDAALVEITGAPPDLIVRQLEFVSIPYSSEMKNALLRAAGVDSSSSTLNAANIALGQLLAEASLTCAEQAGLDISQVDVICSHGHTFWHQPESIYFGDRLVRGTMQLGDAATIAGLTGISVVYDFRSADMAAGGQGAPLVPFADRVLFRSPSENRAIQNIGGIGNVTYLPANCDLDSLIAFDTGPGNMLIDLATQHVTNNDLQYDLDGKLAARGEVDREFLEELMNLDRFLHRPPPKSTGREQFGNEYFELTVLPLAAKYSVSNHNLVATMTAFTAESIASAYQNFLLKPLDRVIVGGGGIMNHTLMNMLRAAILPTPLNVCEEFGINSGAKEAIAFAILGYETLHSRPSNVRSATGASKAVILGSIFSAV